MRHVLAGAFDELLIKPFGLVGCSGAGERGSVALLAVGVQGELRNDEHLAVHVGKRAVRLAVLVLEDAQLEDLAPQPLDLVGAVVRAHAQQDQVPALARAYRFAIDIHLRMRHALHQCPHKALLPRFAFQHNASRGPEASGIVGVAGRTFCPSRYAFSSWIRSIISWLEWTPSFW